MQKKLLFVIFTCAYLLPTIFSSAQVIGNPELKAARPPLIDPNKSQSRLSDDLKRLYETNVGDKRLRSAEKPLPLNEGMEKLMQVKGNRVVVDITATGDVKATRAELERMGVKINAVFGRVISASIPIDLLPQLESATQVRYVRPAYKAVHASKPVSKIATNPVPYKPVEPVFSQGDTAQRSYIARNKYHVNGKGVKVGILSDSYDNLGGADLGVQRGEIPGIGNPFNHKKPVEVLKDLGDLSGSDEGRGMVEIVHDVAPGAEIAFHTAYEGQADFAQGILDLANAGCKVITDDIFYYAEPFFQDGIIAQSIDMVKKKGVAYFSAAGNSSVRSYESDYRKSQFFPFGPDFGSAHDFSAPGNVSRFFQPIFIPLSGTFIASFQWDQPFFSASGVGAETDLDIFLLDEFGNIVSGSNADNIANGDPVEVFAYFNSSPGSVFFLVIVNYAGPDPSRLKYLLYGDGAFFLTAPSIPGILAPTIVGHSKAKGAIATGAAWYLNTPAYGLDTPLVESFSSVGGVPTYFDIEGNRIETEIRKKPEITAPDGGNTSFFEPFGNGDIPQDSDTFPNFFGTSAAAPHAAGVAALMIQAQKLKTITPDQIRGVMSTHTADMNNIYTTGFDKGFDFNTGAGLILADAAVETVRFPNLYVKNLKLQSACSDNPATTRNWKIINPNPFEVPAHWFIAGSSQEAKLVAAPGETNFSASPNYYQGSPLPTIAFIDWEDNFGFPRFDVENSSSATCNGVSIAAIENQRVSERFVQVDEMQKQTAEVYPNPSSTNFRVYLSFSNGKNIDLELYNIEGKKLYQKTVAAVGVVDIDASQYKTGIYILRVKQKDFNKSIKLIRK